MSELTHIDKHGRATMVDTSDKEVTARRAIASARVLMSAETVAAIRNHTTPKGDPLETARLAGVMAAKRTAELIPLCHPLPIEHVDVMFEVGSREIRIEAMARIIAKTDIEMEALTAVSVAALTIYDMCKAVDKKMAISDIRLIQKTKKPI